MNETDVGPPFKESCFTFDLHLSEKIDAKLAEW